MGFSTFSATIERGPVNLDHAPSPFKIGADVPAAHGKKHAFWPAIWTVVFRGDRRVPAQLSPRARRGYALCNSQPRPSLAAIDGSTRNLRFDGTAWYTALFLKQR